MMSFKSFALGYMAAAFRSYVKDVWDTDPGGYWQSIVTDAYDMWRNENDTRATEVGEDGGRLGDNYLDYKGMLKLLEPYQKMATLIGGFNQQVLNGGIQQWGGNGMADKAAVIRYLRKIDLPTCNAVADYLEDTDSRQQGNYGFNGKNTADQFNKWYSQQYQRMGEEVAAYLYNAAIEGRIS